MTVTDETSIFLSLVWAPECATKRNFSTVKNLLRIFYSSQHPVLEALYHDSIIQNFHLGLIARGYMDLITLPPFMNDKNRFQTSGLEYNYKHAANFASCELNNVTV